MPCWCGTPYLWCLHHQRPKASKSCEELCQINSYASTVVLENQAGEQRKGRFGGAHLLDAVIEDGVIIHYETATQLKLENLAADLEMTCSHLNRWGSLLAGYLWAKYSPWCCGRKCLQDPGTPTLQHIATTVQQWPKGVEMKFCWATGLSGWHMQRHWRKHLHTVQRGKGCPISQCSVQMPLVHVWKIAKPAAFYTDVFLLIWWRIRLTMFLSFYWAAWMLHTYWKNSTWLVCTTESRIMVARLKIVDLIIYVLYVYIIFIICIICIISCLNIYIDIRLYVQEQVFCKKEWRKHEKPTGWGSCFVSKLP